MTYKSVTTDAQGHLENHALSTPNNYDNYNNGVINATDYAAYTARANVTNPAYVFAIGFLGGNSTTAPPDPILMQRIANDPEGEHV